MSYVLIPQHCSIIGWRWLRFVFGYRERWRLQKFSLAIHQALLSTYPLKVLSLWISQNNSNEAMEQSFGRSSAFRMIFTVTSTNHLLWWLTKILRVPCVVSLMALCRYPSEPFTAAVLELHCSLCRWSSVFHPCLWHHAPDATLWWACQENGEKRNTITFRNELLLVNHLTVCVCANGALQDNFLRGDISRRTYHHHQQIQRHRPLKKAKPPALSKKHKKKGKRGAPKRPQKPIPPALPQGNLGMPSILCLPTQPSGIR